VGLLARFFEDKGIPTTSVYFQEEMVEKVPAPRMIQVDWPFGHPFGEPNKPGVQAMMIRELLTLFETSEQFSELLQPDWPWRRTTAELPKEWAESVED
jgi:hypothetical protein